MSLYSGRFFASPIEAQPRDDLVEIGVEFGGGSVSGGSLVDLQECVLNDILSFGGIPHATPGECPRPALVPTHKFLKGREVTPRGPDHQDRVNIGTWYRVLWLLQALIVTLARKP